MLQFSQSKTRNKQTNNYHMMTERRYVLGCSCLQNLCLHRFHSCQHTLFENVPTYKYFVSVWCFHTVIGGFMTVMVLLMTMVVILMMMIMMMMMSRLMVVKGRRESVVSLLMDRPHQALRRNCKITPTPTPTVVQHQHQSTTKSSHCHHENGPILSTPLFMGRGKPHFD